MSTGGRVAPVAGAGRGIGEAIAPRLAAEASTLPTAPSATSTSTADR
jgi:NAD(P)-dependent dehydrogenase (short-subunit alcohol dehydrogenase family)